MGRFKRSRRAKIRKKVRPIEKKIPKENMRIYYEFVDLFKALVKNKQIKKFSLCASRLGGTIHFEIYLLFWSKPITIDIYPKEDGTLLVSEKPDHFEIVVGRDVRFAQLYQKFVEIVSVRNAGGRFEILFIKKINRWFQEEGKDYFLKKSTVEEDEKDKIDVWIFSVNSDDGVGLQLKTHFIDFEKHKNKHPHIPSMLCNSRFLKEHLGLAVIKVFESYKMGKVEHIDMRKFMKAFQSS